MTETKPTELVTCLCGCNQTFTRTIGAKGRVKKYINHDHYVKHLNEQKRENEAKNAREALAKVLTFNVNEKIRKAEGKKVQNYLNALPDDAVIFSLKSLGYVFSNDLWSKNIGTVDSRLQSSDSAS